MFWRQRVCQSGVAAVPAQDVGHLQRRAARLAARFVDLICQSLEWAFGDPHFLVGRDISVDLSTLRWPAESGRPTELSC
jgi:hypothetical protein